MSTSIIPHFDDGFQTFDFNGIPIKAKLDENDNPMILAGPICKALGLADVWRALAGLPENEKGTIKVRTIDRGLQDMLYVTEPGLYRLIFRSNKPEAEALRKKIFNEILPAIRRTGMYVSKELSPLDIAEQMLIAMRQYEKRLTSVEETLLDRDFVSIETWTKLQGIKTTQSIRQMWGRDAATLSRARGIEIKKASDELHAPNRYHKSILQEVCVAKPKQNGQLPLPD